MLNLKKLVFQYYNLIRLPVAKFNLNYVHVLEKEIQDCKSVLDLGCGINSALGKINTNNKYTVGVDIFKEYIDESKKKKIHDQYFLANIMEIDQIFTSKTFDCVILIDVIEHLEKIEGIVLIKKIKEIAKKKIIIFTPNGFLKTGKNIKNPHLGHKSGWNVKIFKKLNFEVIGMNGIKFLRDNSSCIKYNPKNFWRAISSITNIFIRRIPQFAFHLLCIKKLSQEFN